jgi:hypothetical protein
MARLRHWARMTFMISRIMIFCLAMPYVSASPSFSAGNEKTIDYPAYSIIYEHDNQLWLYESVSQKCKKIADGTAASLAPGRRKIAYSYNHMLHSYDPSKADLIGIHVLDIKSGDDNKLGSHKYDPLSHLPPWDTSWSPDGKYILVDRGTGPERIDAVIASERGKEKITFYTDLPLGVWINDREIVYTDLLSMKGGHYHGSRIAVIDVDGRKRIVKDGTPEVNCHFLELMENGKIFFDQWTMKDGRGEGLPLGIMDLRGKNQMKVDETVTLSGEIKKILSIKGLSICEADYIDKNRDWVIFVLNREGASQDNKEIYIMRLDNRDTMKKIVDGFQPLVLDRI